MLRLSSTLRIINEELNRYNKHSSKFSKKRFAFFINRAWLLSHGIAQSLKNNDENELSRLLWTPDGKTYKKIEVVTIGVSKKVVQGVFCSFVFRLRSIKKTAALPSGQPLTWSCVFPLKPDTEIPVEGFLLLPQRQKFQPGIFLEGKSINLHNIIVTMEKTGIARISFDEKSKVTMGSVFKKWDSFKIWNWKDAYKRYQEYNPGPLDLEIEMQEEIILDQWKIVDESENDDYIIFKIKNNIDNENGLMFETLVSKGIEGETLLNELNKLKQNPTNPPLYGTIHYERCRMILQPLSLFMPDGMKHLMVSNKKVDSSALLRTLNF
ncbi:MAG: hypothetical protein OMM_03388 [Candidatus Magnetoglobus multicellularis str. Araruama]|uniref:Uncharacterized protein n=1 Tax=Candidatus Magnetoglobus multicellularis str. Araruama TaxID=890399 RepID=A0A1V1P671_9BACT|nr:MAG: hypothetical protein OMM_03388 [Candidatus Magnetoglobus multicellularis str. Araruama]